MKIAVITGASSGMGREFARQLPHCMKHLDELWVVARQENRLLKLQEKSPVPVRIFVSDLSRKKGLEAFSQALMKERPNIRILVNSAGYGKTGAAFSGDRKGQLGMLDVNCRALTDMTLLCLPYMKPGARIVQLASAAAFAPQPGFAVYAATKAYVLSFSRALNCELKEKGISITTVCPGPVDTAFFEVSGTADSKAKQLVMADPKKVVTQALKDAGRRKELSVYGCCMKGARLCAKLIPHKWIMALMQEI